MKKNLFRLLLLFVPLFFCAAQTEEGMAGRLSSISSALSAAHISLAPGTRIRVTNLETGRGITLIVNRRLSPDSTHIVELTVPAAEAIGLGDEARVRVETINSGGTPAAASGSSQTETGAVESRNNRETAAGQGPDLRGEPETERTSREPVTLPPVRVSQSRRDTVNEQETGTEVEDESGSGEFYYTNSYEGEYSGDSEDSEPLLSRESGLSPGDIVTLSSETDQAASPPAAPPARTRPVPPPPAAPPAQTRPAPPAAASVPVPPPEREPPPPASPQSGRGTASARLALPADTDRVVLSMNRDESGKLWVYVESETAEEIAITEVPRPAPIQTPAPNRAPAQPPSRARPPSTPPSQVWEPLPVPPAPMRAPPPVPPPVPERRQVTVTIIPRLPPAGDGKRYILQVGSYRDRGTAEYRLFSLQNAGIAAVTETHGAAIRIIINGVYAEEIPALAEKLGKAGVTEIWIRER